MSDWITSSFNTSAIEFSFVYNGNWLPVSNLMMSVDGPAAVFLSQLGEGER